MIEDVFEAVRKYEPNNPFLKVKRPYGRKPRRQNNTFEVMKMEKWEAMCCCQLTTDIFLLSGRAGCL